jgi:hypothetical protein
MTIDNGRIAEFVRTSAAEVFTTMLGVELEPSPEHVDPTDPQVSEGVLTFTGLAGP